MFHFPSNTFSLRNLRMLCCYKQFNGALISYRLYMIHATRRNRSHFSSLSLIEENYACATRSYRETDFIYRNEWLFFVYMIPLRDFLPEWNSRPGTATGVNSRQYDSFRYDIFWWYHVNQYRATRRNQSELAPARKSPRYHVKHPLNVQSAIF